MFTQYFKQKCSGDVVTADKMGFYIFGGLNHKKEPTNDLFHIKPCYAVNTEHYDMRLNEYTNATEPRLYIEIKKLKPNGMAPPERCMHTAEHINGCLYIIGGKNDNLYKQVKNTALNDIHCYDIAQNEWKTIAMYGYVPMSRWGHCTTVHHKKIVIFGGKNLEKYAPGER